VSKDKPFYLREPWSVLFKDNRLEKISPWSIDLVYLLTTLLEEMNRVGIDFRMAGTAINSSVIIYKKKAELLLKMEEPPEEPPVKPDVYVPPPLTLPFRFEFTTTTISDLITALERALTEERRAPKARLPVLPVPIPDFLEAEAYLLEIEERADNLLERLERSYRGKPLSFFDLATYDNLLEVVRVFMMLLFLAQRDKIDLYQDEDEADILIRVKETELIE
jgi:chromatin segregation and condensation protein Rec8/ScpA/Scc1 (kleisin family)